MNSYKKLVISPHADDEVLGPGGILDSDTFVYYVGIDESSLPEHILADTKTRIPIEGKREEIAAVANFFDFDYEINEDNKVNHYKVINLISQFETIINKVKPYTIFIPERSGYNQDHQAIYDALMVALRPHDRNHFVKKVLAYEQPHTIIWNTTHKQLGTHFIPIDIERKMKGYELYKSQVRGMRPSQTLKDIAALRGKSANVDYAESYQVLRWVE